MANPLLTPKELPEAYRLPDEIRARLQALADGDRRRLFACRRKNQKAAIPAQ